MELRHLRYFVAVAEELSFTRAAERLHISQPPLSRRIQDLEEDIGAPLFDRNGPKLALTAAGADFLRESLVILERVGRATENARSLAAGHAGTVHVGYMAGALYTSASMALIKRFQATYPEVRMSFTLMPHSQQFEALADGRLDLGIVYEGGVPAGVLNHHTLSREPLAFMFPKGHRLVRTPTLRLADMVDEPFIMPVRSHVHGLHDRLLAAWATLGVRPRIVIESDSFPTTVMLVASGVGISFTGRQSALNFASAVEVRAAEDFYFDWGAQAVWVPGRESPALQRLLALMRTP